MVIFASLLIPAHGTIVDIAIILSLTSSVLLPAITIFARDPADIAALPVWVLFVVYTRLGASVLMANTILAGANSGMIIGTIAKFNSGSTIILSTLCIAAVLSILTGRQIVTLKNKALFWLTEIRPEKELANQILMEQGQISSEQYAKNDARLKMSSKLYVGICASTRLIVCDCALCIVTAAITLGGVKIINSLSTGNLANFNAMLGLIVVSAAPIFCLSAASRCLQGKEFFNLLPEPKPIDHKVIPVPSKEVSTSIEDENFDTAQASFDLTSTSVPEFNYQSTPTAGHGSQGTISQDFATVTFNYDAFADTIAAFGKSSILLLAESPGDLPATVPVNIAIKLAQSGKKILIIDTDHWRDALARVFDIESSWAQGKAVASCIENLWITPADIDNGDKTVPLQRKVRNALRVFDHVLIYSPRILETQHYIGNSHEVFVFCNLDTSLSCKQIANSLRAIDCRIHAAGRYAMNPAQAL